jgi:hypothetical protein
MVRGRGGAPLAKSCGRASAAKLAIFSVSTEQRERLPGGVGQLLTDLPIERAMENIVPHDGVGQRKIGIGNTGGTLDKVAKWVEAETTFHMFPRL